MNSFFMNEAISEALLAEKDGEIPVGAVIVKDGEIIARAHNRRMEKQNALSHAEIEAINIACRFLHDWRLDGCELYVTLEPCPMCAGAIIQSRIDSVIFGAYDLKAGCADSVTNMFSMPFEKVPEVYGGIMEDKCRDLLKTFFERLRNE